MILLQEIIQADPGGGFISNEMLEAIRILVYGGAGYVVRFLQSKLGRKVSK